MKGIFYAPPRKECYHFDIWMNNHTAKKKNEEIQLYCVQHEGPGVSCKELPLYTSTSCSSCFCCSVKECTETSWSSVNWTTAISVHSLSVCRQLTAQLLWVGCSKVLESPRGWKINGNGCRAGQKRAWHYQAAQGTLKANTKGWCERTHIHVR